MNKVAEYYLVGLGVRQNDTEAIAWLEKEIKFDKFHAPLQLAECYWHGYGVEQDLSQACDYYYMAAERDHPVAIRKLASA